MQFIHQTSKTSIKALFWVFLEGATVFRGHTNSAPMPYTNILRLSVFLSLVLVQVVLSRCSWIVLCMHTKTNSDTSCGVNLPNAAFSSLVFNGRSRSEASLTLSPVPPSFPALYFSSPVPPPLEAVSLPWSPTSKFTALISPRTCLASRCVRPAVVLGPVGWVQGSLWLTAVLSREWQTFPALSPRSMTLPLFPPQAAVTGWPITGLQV